MFFLNGDKNKFKTLEELIEFHQKNQTRLGYEKEVVILKDESLGDYQFNKYTSTYLLTSFCSGI